MNIYSIFALLFLYIIPAIILLIDISTYVRDSIERHGEFTVGDLMEILLSAFLAFIPIFNLCLLFNWLSQEYDNISRYPLWKRK